MKKQIKNKMIREINFNRSFQCYNSNYKMKNINQLKFNLNSININKK